MGFYGILWDFMGFYGILWDLMDFMGWIPSGYDYQLIVFFWEKNDTGKSKMIFMGKSGWFPVKMIFP